MGTGGIHSLLTLQNGELALKEKRTQFGYTLGSYTSYIHPETEEKNIVYPYRQYEQHWILGFVYERVWRKRNTSNGIYSFDTLMDIPLPFDNVKAFM